MTGHRNRHPLPDAERMTSLAALVEQPGGHTIDYRDPGFPDRSILLHSARPRHYGPDMPVLFVHHGVRRNGKDYRDYWARFVDQAGILAIAVEFPETGFPDYLCYHFGNMHAADGTPNPRAQWTYGVIPAPVRRAARAGYHPAGALRPVRPLRRRAVRPPHAVLRLPRARGGGGQRQRRHLRDAGPGDPLALRPRRHATGRRGLAARCSGFR